MGAADRERSLELLRHIRQRVASTAQELACDEVGPDSAWCHSADLVALDPAFAVLIEREDERERLERLERLERGAPSAKQSVAVRTPVTDEPEE